MAQDVEQQKQLLQTFFTQSMDDDQGIPYEAYLTLCDLADAMGVIFVESDRVRACDGRAYLKFKD